MQENFVIYTDYGRVTMISEKVQNVLNSQINKEF